MVNSLKKSVSILAVISVFLGMLAGCAERDPLLGHWEEPASGVTLNIGRDGDLVIALNGVSMNMTYELQEPNIMIFKALDDGTIPDQQMTYRIEDDKLILTVDGIDTTFTRKK